MFLGHEVISMIMHCLSYCSLSLSLNLRSGQAFLPISKHNNYHAYALRQQLPIASHYRHHPPRNIFSKSLLNEASQEQEELGESISTTATSETSSMNNSLPKNKYNNYFMDIFGLSLKSKSPPTLIMPVITIILACTRPIPFCDRFFSISFPLYLCLANRFRFDRNAKAIKVGKDNKLPLLREGSGPWFKPYILTFASIGILLPLLFQIVAPITTAIAIATATDNTIQIKKEYHVNN